MTLKFCRHCHAGRVTRPRGLCHPCYGDLGIRCRYPAVGNNGGVGRDNPQRLPAPAPTPHRQGTPEKLATLIERAEKKLELFHPADGNGD